MPTQRPAFRPSSPQRSTRRISTPSVCTGVEECQKVVRKLAAAGVDVIKIMATGGVLDPGAHGPRAAFHRRGDEGDRRHGARHAPQGRRPCPRRARDRRRDQRRRRFDRARHVPRRGRGAGDEGARHLLFRDPDGVQRRPGAARHRQAHARDARPRRGRPSPSGARASTSPTAPASRSRSAPTARSLRTARPTRSRADGRARAG